MAGGLLRWRLKRNAAADTNRYKQMQPDATRCKHVQTDANRCKQMQTEHVMYMRPPLQLHLLRHDDGSRDCPLMRSTTRAVNIMLEFGLN